MAREYINVTDFLNTGREKLNKSIDKAYDADEKSDDAKGIAETAENKADSVQAQFDQVVIDGDSSVEAAQARVDAAGNTFLTLKRRLDDENQQFTAQLAQTEDEINQLHIVKRHKGFKHFAHMGSHAAHVENSMNAFKKAVEEGYFGIKMDISQTSDGEFVLMHDEEISQVTTGTGKIREVTSNYLQTVTLKDNRYPGQKVPTLKEVLLYFRNTHVVPLLDLKYLHYSNDTMEKLVDLIVECDMAHQTIIQMQWLNYINYIRSINKDIFLVWLKDATLTDLEEIKDIPLIGIATIPQLTGYVLPEDAINFAKAHNILTLAFIGGSPTRIKGAYNQRMDGIIVDNITQMGGALYV